MSAWRNADFWFAVTLATLNLMGGLLLGWNTGYAAGVKAERERLRTSVNTGIASVRPAPRERRGKPLHSHVRVSVPETHSTRSFVASVTAYCSVPKRTAFPRNERPGTCATDWNVIPQYSTVYVAGRKLIARGRHGKRGRVVDIYMPSRSECLKWGRKTMRVEVVR